MSTPIDLTNPAALRDQAASLNFGDWLTHASEADLHAIAAALETMVIQMHSERVARQWRAQANSWIGTDLGVVA